MSQINNSLHGHFKTFEHNNITKLNILKINMCFLQTLKRVIHLLYLEVIESEKENE